jgi:flagellar motor protein MotB
METPEHNRVEAEEEDKIEVDERWLMTYADKMTILCGLFIMLFAMSKMDEGKIQKIKESAKKTFGNAGVSIGADTSVNSSVKVDPSQALLAQAQKKLKESERLRQELLAKLTQKERSLQEKVEKLQTQEKLQKQQDRSYSETSEKDKVELVNLKKQLAQAQAAISKQQVPNASFMAFVMSWDTESHDVDLRIEDPQGKIFDFKNRQHKNTPGRFVIDTRRGPGTEVWQSDKAVPGDYKFTYEFYNSYGNPAPCAVTGTLFTQNGSIDVPKMVLDIATKKKQTFVISVDGEGRAKAGF